MWRGVVGFGLLVVVLVGCGSRRPPQAPAAGTASVQTGVASWYGPGFHGEAYADRAAISEELTYARQIFTRHGWPMIDVSRRSIEETAAAILALRGRAR